MTKPWCVIPFVHMYASDPIWDDKVCCVASNKLKTWADNPENWLEEKWTSEYMVDLRKRMFDEDAELPECSECIAMERNNGLSDRMQHEQYYKDEDIEYNIETGNQYGAPIDFDLRPGNMCNLQCRMCGPASSSQLNKEIKSNKTLFKQLGHKYDVVDGSNWSSEKNLSYIEKSLPNTKKIKFLGGEPTIMPDVNRLLENMNQNKIYDTLGTLHFTTNGTNLNRKFYDKIKNYKTVDVNLSIDGIDKVVEYIRYPLNFKKFKENYESVRTLDNVSVVLNCTVQSLNIHHMLDYTKWALETNDDFNFVLVSHPQEYSMSALPKSYRDKYCDMVLLNEIAKNQKVQNSRLIEILERAKSIEYDEGVYEGLIRHCVVYDMSRKQKLQNNIPELWELIATDYKKLQRDYKFNTDASGMKVKFDE